MAGLPNLLSRAAKAKTYAERMFTVAELGPLDDQSARSALRQPAAELDVRFSSPALDMIVTPEGEYVSLELNPNGQWLWIEEELGFPLVATMADLLTTSHLSKRESGVRPLLPVS